MLESRDNRWLDLLVDLATDDASAVADAVSGITPLPRLDRSTASLVRLAALFAVRCDLQTAASGFTHCLEASAAPEDLSLTLEAIAPLIGSSRTQIAAQQLAIASDAGFWPRRDRP